MNTVTAIFSRDVESVACQMLDQISCFQASGRNNLKSQVCINYFSGASPIDLDERSYWIDVKGWGPIAFNGFFGEMNLLIQQKGSTNEKC